MTITPTTITPTTITPTHSTPTHSTPTDAIGAATPDRTVVATTPAPTPAWQHRAMVAGGLLFALGNALHPLRHDDDAYQVATWEAAHLVILVGLPMLVLGMPALQQRLRARLSGPLATFCTAATTVGLIGLAPGLVIEAFVAPSVGHEAMQALEDGGMGAVNGLFGVGYLLGGLALAWAAHRARLTPRWAPSALAVSVVSMAAVMGSTSRAAGAVVIAGTVGYGLALAALGRPRPARSV